jgi:ATP-dependent DNA helicase DinG
VTARLTPPASAAIRAAITLAGGREVCFVCTLDDEQRVATARVVARGDVASVLALPGFAGRGEMLVHNHPSGHLEPSDADLNVAARMYDNGVGFAIVDNAATALYVVVEVPKAAERTPLDPSLVGSTLGPTGPIASTLSRYEHRESQQEMVVEIAELYNTGGVGLLEAGTGVGKSLAYLVPALRWAAANGERTVVSTNTINLQEQLVGKDLPFLGRALADQPVRFALLKGWRNYLCLARLETARATGGGLFDTGVEAELRTLSAWAARTSDGSLADLPSPPRPELWDEVAAEPDLCSRMQCPHFSDCFLFRARREAAQADIVVVNHHLLMSDVAVRRAQQNWQDAAVLPAYTRLVVDEGHHLEDAAAAHLGSSVTRRGLQRLFGRLDRKGKGLLGALVARLSRKSDLLSTASLDLVQGRLIPAAAAAKRNAEVVFDLLEQYVKEEGGGQVRLTSSFTDHRIWSSGLSVALEDLLREISLLNESLRVIRERHEREAARDEVVAPLFNEIRGVGRRLETAGDALRLGLAPPADAAPSVRWVEIRGAPPRAGERPERNVAVSTVPLDLAPILREDLFARLATTVVTSATLTSANQGFGFLARRLGVDEMAAAPRTAIFPSPFDYEHQAMLAVPTDVAPPNVDAARHFAAVCRVVGDLADASDGGMFVLCTSHRDVREIAAQMRGRQWPLLVHGEEPRDVLLNRFRDCGRAVLLGTASFWEGVDVPGDALRALLIAKLPFRVPTEPVTAAHCEAIVARGGDPFAEYMLPHASLRLKQGFGRLIRSTTDRGVVVVTDPRLVTKSYGRVLLDALPPARRVLGPWAKICATVQGFYAATSALSP